MFGYCDNSKCNFDIWSPFPNSSAIENRAFSAFCKHTTERDEIVERIVAGDTNITLDDDFSESDLAYIKNRLEREYGIYTDLSIS